MAKKPSISFYTSDFISQTMFLSFEDKGKLIMLYCLQHQHGHLTKDQMEQVCGNLSTGIMSFFQTDSEGKYYNEQIEQSMIERENFIKRQKEKVNKRWKKDTTVDTTVNTTEYTAVDTTVIPLEDEDEEEKEDVKGKDKKEKKVGREKGKFQKPTKQELLDYAKEKSLKVGCIDDFMDYYDSNGWRVGKAGLPMKDWKASFRKWCRNSYDTPKNKSSGNEFVDMLRKEGGDVNIFSQDVVDVKGEEQ